MKQQAKVMSFSFFFFYKSTKTVLRNGASDRFHHGFLDGCVLSTFAFIPYLPNSCDTSVMNSMTSKPGVIRALPQNDLNLKTRQYSLACHEVADFWITFSPMFALSPVTRKRPLSER